MRRAVVALLLLAAATASCADGGTSGPAGGDLTGVRWILDDASIGSLVDDPPARARVDIRFEPDGRAGGTAACNHFGATYVDGGDGSLTIESGAITEMACEEPLMQLETAFIAALGDVAGAQVSAAGLLLTGGGVALSFTVEQPRPLVGTTWVLDAIATGGGGAVSSVIAGTEASLVFGDDGSLSGGAGCNRIMGSYALEGGSLTFSPLATTKIACPGPVGDQEAAVLAGLEATASHSIEGGSLSLLDREGAFLLGYVAA